MRVKAVFYSIIEEMLSEKASKDQIYKILKLVEGGLSPSTFERSISIRNTIYRQLLVNNHFEVLFSWEK